MLSTSKNRSKYAVFENPKKYVKYVFILQSRKNFFDVKFCPNTHVFLAINVFAKYANTPFYVQTTLLSSLVMCRAGTNMKSGDDN